MATCLHTHIHNHHHPHHPTLQLVLQLRDVNSALEAVMTKVGTRSQMFNSSMAALGVMPQSHGGAGGGHGHAAGTGGTAVWLWVVCVRITSVASCMAI